MTAFLRAAAVALLAACTLAPAAQANVLIGGTRVILPAKDGEVTLRLTNENDTPALVQAWIDNGDAKSTPDNVDTPFLITPPMFRMEPKRDQNLRILYTREPLPADRESLFWLNVLEVPPKPVERGPDANYLQLALRSRLKLFFRPEGLQGDPIKAPAELVFHAVGNALVVNNPTPFHITLTDIVVQVGGKAVAVEGGMVAPKSELRLAAAGLSAPAGTPVRFNAINDFGTPAPFVGATAP
ncbi:molecular chaperone [Lysobacter soli]|uniref:fimbrial biogenesis chaperone n=1 Tax=Lysobacter TaxID=68 RepID=UPI00178AA702|nr:molecular chaperone [Lysobacter soli]MDG2517757.1 molecular chaperone [Lysobacter soli]UTA54856.1 molecular chaperone [Lysobacter soli]